MGTTFGFKFHCCGDMFLFKFSLSQRRRVCLYKRDHRVKLSDEYLSSLFTKVYVPKKSVPAEKDIPHIDNDFGHEDDALGCSPTNEKIEMEELFFSCDDSSDVG